MELFFTLFFITKRFENIGVWHDDINSNCEQTVLLRVLLSKVEVSFSKYFQKLYTVNF